MSNLPDGLIAYGSDTNCTLAICPVEWSVLGYRPSVPANAIFVVLFTIALAVHLAEGIRWRHTLGGFAIPMALGCIDEIIGYAGRLILHGNPFSFSGFLMEIICITTAPVFFCAAIYVTLARTINFLDPTLARFNPKFFYWLFIPCDVVSLVFQAAGGALSSTGDGGDNTGVDMSLFGLALQVFTLLIFIGFSADYLIRYYRSSSSSSSSSSRSSRNRSTAPRFRIFFAGLWAAILFILIRCIYRIDELSDGYNGDLFRNEGIFYGLESAMVIAAVFALTLGQPGFGLQGDGDGDGNGGIGAGGGGSGSGGDDREKQLQEQHQQQYPLQTLNSQPQQPQGAYSPLGAEGGSSGRGSRTPSM